jgi:hypothetical protein
VVCDNFTVSFIPGTVDYLAPGEEENITVRVNVSSDFPFGLTSGTINVSGENTSTTVNISVFVSQNLSWIHSPSILSRSVLQQTNGTFGEVSIRNTGNDELFLLIDITGNSSIFSANVTNISLEIGETTQISINFSSPETTSIRIFTASLRSTNSTASPSEQTTLLNLTVHPLFANITSPTEANPLTNVDAGENVEVNVNVTFAGLPVDANITWNVSLFNSTNSVLLNLTEFNFSNITNLWSLNFTAPNLTIARRYSLNVTLNYTTRSLATTEIENDAIIYTDSNPPLIDISLPVLVPVNTTLPIKINVTDPGGIDNVTLNMTFPGGNSSTFVPTLVSSEGDKNIYALNFTNTSQTGIYTIKVNAFDISGNLNTSTLTFEIFPAVLFTGYTFDEENAAKPPIRVNFTFLNNITPQVLTIVISNSTTGFYNKTLEARIYDLEIRVFNNTLDFDNVNIDSDAVDPVFFGRIPQSRIGVGAVTGLYMTTTFNYSNLTIAMDFSSYSGIDASLLSLFECSRYNATVGCDTTWDKISSALLNKTLQTISVSTTNSTLALALGQYICGNNVCEESNGETFVACPQDCEPEGGGEFPPQPPSPPGVGAGGGGAGAGGGANVTVNVTVPEVEFVPLELKSTLIDIVLRPGESVTHSIELTNNLNKSVTAQLSLEGVAANLLTLQKTSVTIPKKSIEIIQIVATALPSTAPGIYKGDIIVTSDGKEYRLPVTIKVEIPSLVLLDVFVKALTKIVAPGEKLQVSVKLENMGETAKIEDIIIDYIVKQVNTENITISESETVAVEETLSFQKTITIPEGTPEGTYIIQIDVNYANGDKFASAADSFEVTALPPTLVFLYGLLLNPLFYIILFAVIPGIYGSRKFYKSYKLKKVKKARYIFPVDYKKLPQPGPDSIKVGKIAETDKDAFVNIKGLMMHSIAAGGTGSGKSVSAMVVAENLLKRKIPVIVFDPTAQWTGFIKAQTDKQMLDLYPKFGLKPSDAQAFKTNIFIVKDPSMEVDVTKHMKPGEITVFVMSSLRTADIDKFVRKTIDNIFAIQWPESPDLKLMIIYDEVHRLLPKYGGKGGYVALERGCREFRKWGIGLFLISQVLSDFKGAIRANIAMEIQLRTKYVGDINRVKSKYGPDYAARVVKLVTGTGLVQNPEFNDGKPWFVSFRPLLHNTRRLTEAELKAYVDVNEKINNVEKRLEALKSRGVDVYDVELELNMAKDKMKSGLFKMAQTYLESVEARVKKLGG